MKVSSFFKRHLRYKTIQEDQAPALGIDTPNGHLADQTECKRQRELSTTSPLVATYLGAAPVVYKVLQTP